MNGENGLSDAALGSWLLEFGGSDVFLNAIL